VATALTALSFTAWWFFLFRFLTGFGIGGEYAAINSAIDELIPARHRGRIDGTFWLGAFLGALITVPLLQDLPVNVGWRIAFALGAVLAVVILLVRRHVPESPRWLFIHGRDQEAEAIVRSIEDTVERETGQRLEAVHETIRIQQRTSTTFTEIARTILRRYPRRAVLAFALFVGQAFLYNAKLFDTVGRRVMIAGTYITSGVLLFATALLFSRGVLNAITMTLCWCVVLFFVSAGASSAYLTVSEVFPLETRAMAIAFFYAIGTAVGGVTGPLLFSHLVGSKRVGDTVLAFSLGAALMLAAGVVAAFLGVRAERRNLEELATPLSAEAAEREQVGASTA
jgi:MFS family permease